MFNFFRIIINLQNHFRNLATDSTIFWCYLPNKIEYLSVNKINIFKNKNKNDHRYNANHN